MNKDKIIKDLKERNDKLQNQYILGESRNSSLNYRIGELNRWINNCDKDLDKKIDKLEATGYRRPLYSEIEVLEHQSYIITSVKDKLKELGIYRKEGHNGKYTGNKCRIGKKIRCIRPKN